MGVDWTNTFSPSNHPESLLSFQIFFSNFRKFHKKLTPLQTLNLFIWIIRRVNPNCSNSNYDEKGKNKDGIEPQHAPVFEHGTTASKEWHDDDECRDDKHHLWYISINSKAACGICANFNLFSFTKELIQRWKKNLKGLEAFLLIFLVVHLPLWAVFELFG